MANKSYIDIGSRFYNNAGALQAEKFTSPKEILYGKDDGSQGEIEISWDGWLNSDGSAITLSGGTWGEIYIPSLGVISPIIHSSDGSLLTYYTNLTRYTNTFVPTIYFRSSNVEFSQIDVLPSYSLYTSPISTSNQYTQIKLTRNIL
jgi:hypothetical protein